MRQIVFLLVTAFVLAACLVAAESAIVGKWDCVAYSDEESRWVLEVKETEGKLSGKLTGEGGEEIPLVDPKLEKAQFTFTIMINGQPVKFEGTVTADKLEGKYWGEEAQGTVKAKKRG